MKKFEHKELPMLILALCLCLISMIGTACMQGNWGRTSVKTYYLTTAELAEMIRANNQITGKDIQTTFSEDTNARFSFMSMIPKSARADNPAPAVILIHGGGASKEIEMNNYIELCRRGFVVISMDASQHGFTDKAINDLTNGSLGALAAVEYAMSLPCVDETRIGVSGHSMGNEACFYAITNTNVEGYPNPRIAAWVEGAGSMFAPQMTPELCDGLIWTMSIDKYDEYDTVYFNAGGFLDDPMAGTLVKNVYPAFSEASVTQGVFYTADGVVQAPDNGQRLDAQAAFMLMNPPLTHPMFLFSKKGTAITLNGFYNGLGAPNGAAYLSADNQVWPVCVAFELIGLFGFFMLLFPLVSLLADTKFFAGIKRDVPEQDKLVSGINPLELLIWIVTIVVLVAFSFYAFVTYFPRGDGGQILNEAVYGLVGHPNAIGFWSLQCGLFALFIMLLGFGVRKVLGRKCDTQVLSPFEAAKLASVSQFLKTLLFATLIFVLMYIPLYVARYLFNADFRIFNLVAGCVPFKRLPLIIFKYIPLWLSFFIPNAMMNANTRYKDIPEWVTTTVCGLTNALSVIIFLFLQYGTLYSTGALWNPSCGTAGIMGFALVPCLIFAAFSARYIYKKTGNVWAAGILNGMLMCSITTFVANCNTDFIFNF